MEKCGGRYQGTLIGHGIPYVHGVSPGFPAAAEVGPPPSGSCWVLTKVVIRYHVGIRHYTVANPFELAVCAMDAGSQENAATQAAEAAG